MRPLGAFGLHAERLSALGYTVIPISLPTDRVGAPGKQPAQRHGWQSGCPRADWPRYAHCGLGVLTTRAPAIDVDVLDPGLAAQIRNVMDRELGRGPVRIGKPPKFLVPFRLDGEPFAKMACRWRGLGDVGDKPPAIEVLCCGQQFVALGTHPGTNRPYTWERDPDLDLPHGLLDPLSRDRAETFLLTVAAALERLGATEVRLSGVRVPAPPERPQRPQERPQARPRDLPADAERIAQALDRIGNHDLDYDCWIRVGLALKRELPGADGEALWRAWSARSAKDDPAVTARKWATFRPERISVGTIFFLQRGHR